MSKRKIIFGILGFTIFGIYLLNASWLAPSPSGNAQLIAHRGVYHLYDKQNLGRNDCTAIRIHDPKHEVFENTTASLIKAKRYNADMVEVDVAPTKDGEMVFFHDWKVDCRTEGRGETRDLTLSALKSLDIGYGYSSDGGKTFPLRGKGVGQIPTLEEGIAVLPSDPILFNFKSKNPKEADQLFTRLKAAGRNSSSIGDAFYGAENPVKRMRELMPNNWSFATTELKKCSIDYVLYGWSGHIPHSCKGRTIGIPINYLWATWGWPNRFIQRMKDAETTVIIFGDYERGKGNEGLLSSNQLDYIPEGYNGYIWVEDIIAVGPKFKNN